MTTKETKVRLPLELHSWLQAQVDQQGGSITKYILNVLEEHRSALEAVPNYPQLSPTIPNNFEVRLVALEQEVKRLKSEKTTSDWKPNFTIGQVVTGQNSRLYGLLNYTECIQQYSTKNKSYSYYPDLGVVVRVESTAKWKLKYVVAALFDVTQERLKTWVDTSGTTVFMDSSDVWKTEPLELFEEPLNSGDSSGDSLGDTAIAPVASPVDEPPTPANTEPVTETPQIELVVPSEPDQPLATGDASNLVLTSDELVDRFRPLLKGGMANIIKKTLSQVGMKKLEAGWAKQHDPEGLAWVPTNEKTREQWVVFKLSPKLSPELSP